VSEPALRYPLPRAALQPTTAVGSPGHDPARALAADFIETVTLTGARRYVLAATADSVDQAIDAVNPLRRRIAQEL
jgi:hypothetical protein